MHLAVGVKEGLFKRLSKEVPFLIIDLVSNDILKSEGTPPYHYQQAVRCHTGKENHTKTFNKLSIEVQYY